jgi:hypothetical protein
MSVQGPPRARVQQWHTFSKQIVCDRCGADATLDAWRFSLERRRPHHFEVGDLCGPCRSEFAQFMDEAEGPYWHARLFRETA